VFETQLAEDVFKGKYSFDGKEDWEDTAKRVATNVMGALGYSPDSPETRETEYAIRTRKFMPGGRYLYASGRDLHQTQNCLLLKAVDTREGWAQLCQDAMMALTTGAGIGVDYSDLRADGAPLKRTGGTASGPLPLMKAINELGRASIQGGHRRAAIWAGLSWKHPDVFSFIKAKDWSPEMRKLKDKDTEFPLPLEGTNISVILDDEFFSAITDDTHVGHEWAHDVYMATLERMLKTAEPGFSIDTGRNAGETLRNACTEVTSADDSDICNLGSLNLARIKSLEEFKSVLRVAVRFLLAGTVYSDVPYEKVAAVREKNRRLGLGLMGVHEWLLQRDKPYGPDDDLEGWLIEYATSTEIARQLAQEHGLSVPVKTRAIAPTGTIGIIAETTTGMEPIFAVAYERRWLNGSWKTDIVIDPTAQRMVDQGHNPEDIEDAYTIPFYTRVKMQHWLQRFVDHGISSTINLSAPVTDRDEVAEIGYTLLQFLPGLRGVTVYPDGARGHQPIKRLSYTEALERGAVVKDNEDRCIGGSCGV